MIIKRHFLDFDRPKNFRQVHEIVLCDHLRDVNRNNPKVERAPDGSLKILFHTDDEFGLTDTYIEVVIERDDFEELEKLKALGII